MKGLLLILALVCAVGCATTEKLNNLMVGMSREEVIKAMGKPAGTKGQQQGTILVYNLMEDHNGIGIDAPYWLIMNNKDELIQWGRAGDFGTTSQPTQNYNINVHRSGAGGY